MSITFEPLMPGGSPRCQARSKQTGLQCGNPAIPGTNVCRFHGGASPQTRRAARLRLLELVDPAIATLARVMANAEKDSDRIRAAENILDRTGHPRQVSVDSTAARDMLIHRLEQLRDEALAEHDQVVDEAHRVIEGNTDATPEANPAPMSEEDQP